MAVAVHVAGASGAVVQVGGGVLPTGVFAFWTSGTNWAWNQGPDSGALGRALLSTLYWVRNVGSHIRSKPLPSSLGISELAPSESPGGLTHTNASRCDAGKPGGVACGGAPRPAPLWLHHRPRCGRVSILLALTKVLTSVLALAAVGRPAPPQPLREVSVRNPRVVGHPAWVNRDQRSAV